MIQYDDGKNNFRPDAVNNHKNCFAWLSRNVYKNDGIKTKNEGVKNKL